jgi:hypothetical protein
VLPSLASPRESKIEKKVKEKTTLDCGNLTARQPSVKQKLEELMTSIDQFKGVTIGTRETDIQKIKSKYDSKMIESKFFADYALKTLEVIKDNDEF